MQRMLFESHTVTKSRDLYNPVQKWTKSISFTAYKTMKDTLNIVTDDSVWNMHNMRIFNYASYNMYSSTEEFLTTTRTNTHTYTIHRWIRTVSTEDWRSHWHAVKQKKMPNIRSKHGYTVGSTLRRIHFVHRTLIIHSHTQHSHKKQWDKPSWREQSACIFTFTHPIQ